MNDTRNMRLAYLADNAEDKNATKKKLQITIHGTLPIIVTDDITLSDITIKEEDTVPYTLLTDLKNFLVDEDFLNETAEDRFIYITTLKSLLTKNKIMFYYDRKYQDIIIIPDTRFYDLLDANGVYEVNGYRIGSGENIKQRHPDQLLTLQEESVVQLPETKNNITTAKSRLVLLPDSIKGNTTRNNNIINKLDDVNSIYYGETQPSMLIELGTVLELFVNNTKLPAYLLHQYSFENFGIKYVNNLSTGHAKLLFNMKF
ncbi:MAG: hypothetical protein AB7G52_02925 [Arcobacter sp.]